MTDLETRRDQTIQYYANIQPEHHDTDDNDDNGIPIDSLMDNVLTGQTVAPTSHIGGEFEAVMDNL